MAFGHGCAGAEAVSFDIVISVMNSGDGAPQAGEAMAAGSLPRRRVAQAARARRLAALMRMTVEMITFSNALYRALSSSFTALVSIRPEICSDAVTVKSSPATSERPRALNSFLIVASSASEPFTMASARPIASARAFMYFATNILEKAD